MAEWKNPETKTKEQLCKLIRDIQGILWSDEDGNPDLEKEWSNGEIENVADAFKEADLAPE